MDKFKKIFQRIHAENDQILPQNRVRGPFDSTELKNLIIKFALLFLAVLFLLRFIQCSVQSLLATNGGTLNLARLVFNAINPLELNGNVCLLALLFAVVLIIYLNPKMNRANKPIVYGQKGDSRFTTLNELKKQYHSVPDKKDTFQGYGGVPISHYKKMGKGYFLIDQSTSHTIGIGTSRSGKTELEVRPMIDIISRAEEQASMIINDPKGELYSSYSKLLEKRGYRVGVLNLADPDKSIGYNSLALITQVWQHGDIDRAMQLLNSQTYTQFHTQKGGNGQNEWVYADGQAAVNGMVIAMLDFVMDPDNFPDHKRHPEKVTFTNVLDMVSTLGQEEVYIKVGNTIKTSNKLDQYFSNLPDGSFAKQEYSATNLSAANGKGSIMSTIMTQLEMFATPKNARMTSANTIDLRSIGFPKYLNFKLPSDMGDKAINLAFYHAPESNGVPIDKADKTVSMQPSATFTVRSSAAGFVDYNFETEITPNDVLVISYAGRQSCFILKPKKENDLADFLQFKNELEVQDLTIHYSDQPTAIFLKIPDSDSSNNALASIFISQLYNELATQCSLVPSGKVYRRVHFILDEAGNMVPIKDMGHLMTVSASREILFTLMLQSYQQLYSLYGKEEGATIKENGQNLILIASTDRRTLSDFSEAAGNYTAESQNLSGNNSQTKRSFSVSAEKLPLITTERLSQLYSGETLVIRGLYRKDLKNNKFRPFPIFNTGETQMPFGSELLEDFTNNDVDPTTLMPNSEHSKINLKDNAIDWEAFYEAGAKDASQGVSPQTDDSNNDIVDDSYMQNSITQTEFFTAVVELKDTGYITESYASKLITAFEHAIAENDTSELQRILSMEERGVILSDEQRKNLRELFKYDLQQIKAK